mmetsp:Transcript_2798/g.8314  ORF Transcript_2798/g.8314 Transcript_2798/m.8314 type:complete len:334 (+) Transcript_2798:1906-2907(+)
MGSRTVSTQRDHARFGRRTTVRPLGDRATRHTQAVLSHRPAPCLAEAALLRSSSEWRRRRFRSTSTVSGTVPPKPYGRPEVLLPATPGTLDRTLGLTQEQPRHPVRTRLGVTSDRPICGRRRSRWPRRRRRFHLTSNVMGTDLPRPCDRPGSLLPATRGSLEGTRELSHGQPQRREPIHPEVGSGRTACARRRMQCRPLRRLTRTCTRHRHLLCAKARASLRPLQRLRRHLQELPALLDQPLVPLLGLSPRHRSADRRRRPRPAVARWAQSAQEQLRVVRTASPLQQASPTLAAGLTAAQLAEDVRRHNVRPVPYHLVPILPGSLALARPAPC